MTQKQSETAPQRVNKRTQRVGQLDTVGSIVGEMGKLWRTDHKIRSLPAGSTLWVDRIGTREPKAYFSIGGSYCEAEVAKAPAAASKI
jgi:hypothetical protein